MRTKPLLGKKAWFGPRRFGWGLEPVSVEGWLVTAAALWLGLLIRRRRGKSAERRIGPALVLVAFLKGTSPGGPRARKAFVEARGHAGRQE